MINALKSGAKLQKTLELGTRKAVKTIQIIGCHIL